MIEFICLVKQVSFHRCALNQLCEIRSRYESKAFTGTKLTPITSDHYVKNAISHLIFKDFKFYVHASKVNSI